MSLCYDLWNTGNFNPDFNSDKELPGGMKLRVPDLNNKLSLQPDLYCIVYFSYFCSAQGRMRMK